MSSASFGSSEIIPVTVEEELKRSYLDYALSVIISRALPDVRDGLKPVHRRILYTMMDMGFEHDKPYRKSASIVGTVMAKLHPHGDAAIYASLARLAQDFAMRLPLISGHGNFGSIDGDEPASMRYTEARLAHVSHFLMMDYDKQTVEFEANYDNTTHAPVVLPARFPNLLVNGAGGIAVGMATNIPPHHLGEVIDACCLLIDEPDASLEQLMQFLKGPDFPTGGLLLGYDGVIDAYRTGRGTFTLRSRTHIESIRKDRDAIIVTEIPYQVNKATMVERIAKLVNDKEIEGIADLRDESDRHGIRIVIELKKDAIAEVILNKLYLLTPLQTSFSVNALAIYKDRPEQMSLIDILKAFLEFRYDVVVRRTQFYLYKARQRADLLIGLTLAVSHIDEVIALIKSAKDSAQALEYLTNRLWSFEGVLSGYLKKLEEYAQRKDQGIKGDHYQLSDDQAKAILALRLQRLTGMERQNLYAELQKLVEDICGYLALLASPRDLFSLIKTELLEVRDRFATPRKTEILANVSLHSQAEDFIACEDMVVTLSVKGYIKRVPLSAYRSQRRGGRGKQSMTTREEDEVTSVFVTDTHTPILCFTSLGQAYQIKVYELPLGAANSRGKPMVSLLPLSEGEVLATLLPLPKADQDRPAHIVFATSKGSVRKNALGDFLSIRANGKIAIRLDADEKLIGVSLVSPEQDILLSSRLGKSIRFSSADLRQFSSRQSTGVRGMLLKGKDEVVSMSILNSVPYSSEDIEKYLKSMSARRREEADDTTELIIGEDSPETALDPSLLNQMEEGEQFILSVSENGFGKRTSCYFYRRTHRGGQGVATMDITERTGLIINALPVDNRDDILMLSDRGQLIRCPVDQIRICGRKTQGVKIFRMEGGEKIVSIAVFAQGEESEEISSSDLIDEGEKIL